MNEILLLALKATLAIALTLALASAGDADVVCSGLNPLFRIEPRGGTLTLNPGPRLGDEPAGRRGSLRREQQRGEGDEGDGHGERMCRAEAYGVRSGA